MERRLLVRVLWIIGAVVVAAVISRLSGDRLITSITDLLAPVRRVIDRVHSATEYDRLRAELEQAQYAAALSASEREELVFYRTSLGVRSAVGDRAVVVAHITAQPALAGERMLVIDRGTDDGIGVGDAVVTASGSFVGLIGSTGALKSTVRALGDPAIQIAARIYGTPITGLVHSTGGSLVFDLVRKDEAVVEGAVIVTSGDDRLPPAFILGTVSSIDQNATSLFQIIRMRPAAASVQSGFVLVIRP
jgi:rod shape-determining protein MreC